MPRAQTRDVPASLGLDYGTVRLAESTENWAAAGSDLVRELGAAIGRMPSASAFGEVRRVGEHEPLGSPRHSR